MTSEGYGFFSRILPLEGWASSPANHGCTSIIMFKVNDRVLSRIALWVWYNQCSKSIIASRKFLHKIVSRKLLQDRWNGWNSALQAAWHTRHAHWARLCYIPLVVWWLWIKSTMWLLILSSTSFYPHRTAVIILRNTIIINSPRGLRFLFRMCDGQPDELPGHHCWGTPQ